jgi:hypothetical protein
MCSAVQCSQSSAEVQCRHPDEGQVLLSVLHDGLLEGRVRAGEGPVGPAAGLGRRPEEGGAGEPICVLGLENLPPVVILRVMLCSLVQCIMVGRDLAYHLHLLHDQTEVDPGRRELRGCPRSTCWAWCSCWGRPRCSSPGWWSGSHTLAGTPSPSRCSGPRPDPGRG